MGYLERGDLKSSSALRRARRADPPGDCVDAGWIDAFPAKVNDHAPSALVGQALHPLREGGSGIAVQLAHHTEQGRGGAAGHDSSTR